MKTFTEENKCEESSAELNSAIERPKKLQSAELKSANEQILAWSAELKSAILQTHDKKVNLIAFIFNNFQFSLAKTQTVHYFT